MGQIHPFCAKRSNLKKLFCYLPFRGPIKQAIYTMKYRFSYDIANELAELVYERIKMETSFKGKSILLAPVPIYPAKRRKRGFNQSEEVGKRLARKMGWKFIPNLILKTKNTQSQTTLTRQERKKNVSGTFELNKKYKNLKKYQIVIFDDVYTSGATVSEIAGVLKKEGFKNIWGMVVAR